MYLRVPLEVGRDRELDAQRGARDRLHLDGELEARELVHTAVERAAHARQPQQLAELGVTEVVQPLPRHALLLDLANDLLRHLAELAQRAHRLPPGGGGGRRAIDETALGPIDSFFYISNKLG